MRGKFPNPPFNLEAIRAAFGFKVPEAFNYVLNALCLDCQSAEEVCRRVEQTLGWLLADDDERYLHTPPELFTVAATGVDGGHFGYLILAPELGLHDYPIARFEPMDGTGAALIGRSTCEAVETELSNCFLYEEQHNLRSARGFVWWPAVEARLAGLGVFPDTAKAERAFTDYQPASRLSGWKHETSSDGVGVLARSELFSPYEAGVRAIDVEGTLRWSERLNEQGFPASSLLLLRECYWQSWSGNQDDAATLCRAMMETYSALGRPIFAEILVRRVRKFF